MDTNKLLDGLAAGTLTRRDFTNALASVGLGIVTVPMLSRRAAPPERSCTSAGPAMTTRDFPGRMSRNMVVRPIILSGRRKTRRSKRCTWAASCPT